MSATRKFCWCAAARRCSRSGPIAPITTARSSTGSWSTTPCAVPGITPASICAPAKRLRAPALSPIACWSVEQRDGKIFVREKRAAAEAEAARHDRGRTRRRRSSSSAAARPASRRPRCCGASNIEGSIVMLSNDDAPPVDRPNLSKDYLAGNAPEDWVPLRAGQLLFRERHRPAPQGERHRHRRALARGRARRRRARSLTTGCCSQPAPSRSACRSPAPTSRTFTRCARSPTAGPSSSAPRRRAGRS